MVLIGEKEKPSKARILMRTLKMIEMKENSNNKIINSTSIINIIGNQRQNTLNDFYSKLENSIGCTYMFYIYEDMIRDRKIIYTSSSEWQDQLIGEKLINECPIFKAGTEALQFGNKSIILPWNSIQCKTSLEKEIT